MFKSLPITHIRNPDTAMKINVGGPTYKKLVKSGKILPTITHVFGAPKNTDASAKTKTDMSEVWRKLPNDLIVKILSYDKLIVDKATQRLYQDYTISEQASKMFVRFNDDEASVGNKMIHKYTYTLAHGPSQTLEYMLKLTKCSGKFKSLLMCSFSERAVDRRQNGVTDTSYFKFHVNDGMGLDDDSNTLEHTRIRINKFLKLLPHIDGMKFDRSEDNDMMAWHMTFYDNYY